MTAPNYLAAYYGVTAAHRVQWIRAADYRSALNRELFPYWQASAVAYAIAAASAALGPRDRREEA